MKSPQPGGRQTPWTVSIAALLLVALSGCLGASGLGVTGTDAVTQATPNADTTAATEAPPTTAREPGSTIDDTPDGSTAGAATTSSGTATEESSTSTPGDEAVVTTTESANTASSAGASSSASSASSSSSDGSEGSDVAASSEAATTPEESTADAEPTTTPATTATTTEGARTAGSSPAPSVSTPAPATETPLPPPALVSDCGQPVVDDPPVKVVDCQLEDYPQPKGVVEVEVANAGERTVERVRVTLLLFDREGNEVERSVRFVEDLPAGERFGYLYETSTDADELAGRYVVVVQVAE